jgi:ribonuclease Z
MAGEERMKRLLIGLVVIAGVAAAVAYVFRGEIALSLMQSVVEKNMANNAINELPDGLHVGLCGAGAPMPGERGGPCVIVIAGKRLIIVDSGTGGVRTLARLGFGPGLIERVLLTHFHSDHIDGLGEMILQRWVGGTHTAPLPIHGPAGVERIVLGFNEAYSLDQGYRIAHHGADVLPPTGFGGAAAPFALVDGEAVVVDDGELKITAFTVDHAPIEPAVGYRISYKGRTAVISGDTKPNAAVEKAAQGADLLVHEALSPKLVGILEEGARKAGRNALAKIMHDILDYHTTPEQAAEIATRAKVKFLLLYHIVPPLPLSALEGPFLGKARELYSGPLSVGRDGDLVSMPAGSTEVSISNRL